MDPSLRVRMHGTVNQHLWFQYTTYDRAAGTLSVHRISSDLLWLSRGDHVRKEMTLPISDQFQTSNQVVSD